LNGTNIIWLVLDYLVGLLQARGINDFLTKEIFNNLTQMLKTEENLLLLSMLLVLLGPMPRHYDVWRAIAPHLLCTAIRS
jgi:hypothetical protein